MHRSGALQQIEFKPFKTNDIQLLSTMKYRCLFLSFAVLAISCSVEEIKSPELEEYDAPVFYATIDERPNADTKVYADQDLKVLWNEGDLISIFNRNSGNDEYCFKGETGDNHGDFMRVKDFSEEGVSLNKIYAVYPYSRATTMDEDDFISLTLPAEQSYHEKSFGIGANTMISVTKDNKLKFKNVGGYLSLKFYGEGVSVSSIELKSNNGELISGPCVVETSSGIPVVTMSESASDQITMVCETPVALGATSSESVQFIFVLPPMTLSNGFTVKVTTPDGAVFEKSSDRKREIARSSITPLGAMEVTPVTPVIVFADPNVKDAALRWDTDGDGELSYVEAAAVTGIGQLFYKASSITSFDEFKYFTGVTGIVQWAFYNCTSLTSIVVPGSVSSFGEGAFYNCTGLESITVEAEIPPAGADYMLDRTNDCAILVPAGSVEAYKTAEYWSKYADRIFPIGYIPAVSVTLDVSVLELAKESNYAFTATILPENSTNREITWTSSDETIATVSSEGVVTALKAGSATITAQCDTRKAECGLNVVSKSNPLYYSSTDYSQDGQVVQLQQATVGRGINIIFLGDGFLDTDMAEGGKYDQKMNQEMEQFFAYEPYTTFRNRFNVYAVRVVSQNAEYAEDSNRRLTYNEGNSFGMRLSLCTEYASLIPNPNDLPLKIGVIANTEGSVGRSKCYYNSLGWCCGFILRNYGEVLNHEVGGHGFANLLDEYVEKEGSFTDTGKLDNWYDSYGWGANVDWRSDPSTVRWSRFLSDERYSAEGLGVYEGAYLYPYGVYRSTENSMMRNEYQNTGKAFNAPSREQIYKTIMKYSEGDDWVYDYEAFVAADEAGRSQAAAAFSSKASSSSVFRSPSELSSPPVEVDQNVKVVCVDEKGNIVMIR